VALPANKLSPAGQQLFSNVPGLGDMLQAQREDETERLRRLRQAQATERPLGSDLGYGGASLIGGPLNAFGRLR
jgi:hypothetical protein